MKLLVSLVVVLGSGCHLRGARPTPIPAPIPILGLNSPFDDINSSDPALPYREGLVFSTNRGSQGAHFDLYTARVQWPIPDNSNSASQRVHAAEMPHPYGVSLMSESNERAPILLFAPWIGPREQLVFASDRPGGKGGLDLYSAECGSTRACEYPSTLRPLDGLNSPKDDAYLSRPFADRRMLFASNRDAEGTDNDLYVVEWAAQSSFDAVPSAIERVQVLSSAADDTAPFIYTVGADGETGRAELVFVSSRPGGLGEHDLYCSRFDGAWSAPVHLGALSSPRDEYRPIVVIVNGGRFLLFSSTRDGGQGGYDLYAVSYAGCPTR